MSSKINVTEIVKGHYATLKSPSGFVPKLDTATFIVLPVALSLLSTICGTELNAELRSLLVNFGAIFTALLLSVLVLVYDQESKYTKASENDAIATAKIDLLHQLYYNISFSIICAVALIIFAMLHVLIGNQSITFDVGSHRVSGSVGRFLLTPLVIFSTVTIFLNVIMVVKRMHTLLTAR